MAKKSTSDSKKVSAAGKPSSLVDTRVIYCGDNLEQLKKLPENCVDLIYIDPPFNSNRNYEVFWGETKEKRSFDDRHASTQAYIEFMRPRCVELHRVLKNTGSFYYHCDWHASHYVKVMLDQIFGENQFVNEIIWKRATAHNTTTRALGAITDNIFFYSKTNNYVFEPPRTLHDPNYIKTFYRFKDSDGRAYRLDKIERNEALGIRPNLIYEYNGYTPKWGWMMIKEKLAEFDRLGKLVWNSKGKPLRKIYLDEVEKPKIANLWDDIAPVQASSSERLGYPTQKPQALLDRIIKASSNPNDIVLDAFCGCGTALVSAENLGRQWIGIDISPTACRVMAKRMRDVCGMKEDEKLWKIGRGFVVRDLPWSEKQLREIPHFEFENWAVIALGGVPNIAKVGDMGIDGRIYPVSAVPKKTKGELDFMDVWYPIQVKQKDKVGRPDIDSFEAVMMREDRTQGFFVSFDYSQDAMSEIQAFMKKTGKIIRPITVKDILDEQIAYKLT
ncbi:MAG: DNA methyltransferase [Sedimentisphaerales bacterium]|jgi:site-specific DNA-methyltransferase (adenine-specific)